jgi:hypothetical protein
MVLARPNRSQSETARISAPNLALFSISHLQPDRRVGEGLSCSVEFLCLKSCTLLLPYPVCDSRATQIECKLIDARSCTLFSQSRIPTEWVCVIFLPQKLHFGLPQSSQAEASDQRDIGLFYARILHLSACRSLSHWVGSPWKLREFPPQGCGRKVAVMRQNKSQSRSRAIRTASV